jgi:hypothetical protein
MLAAPAALPAIPNPENIKKMADKRERKLDIVNLL